MLSIVEFPAEPPRGARASSRLGARVRVGLMPGRAEPE